MRIGKYNLSWSNPVQCWWLFCASERITSAVCVSTFAMGSRGRWRVRIFDVRNFSTHRTGNARIHKWAIKCHWKMTLRTWFGLVFSYCQYLLCRHQLDLFSHSLFAFPSHSAYARCFLSPLHITFMCSSSHSASPLPSIRNVLHSGVCLFSCLFSAKCYYLSLTFARAPFFSHSRHSRLRLTFPSPVISWHIRAGPRKMKTRWTRLEPPHTRAHMIKIGVRISIKWRRRRNRLFALAKLNFPCLGLPQ